MILSERRRLLISDFIFSFSCCRVVSQKGFFLLLFRTGGEREKKEKVLEREFEKIMYLERNLNVVTGNGKADNFLDK